MNNFAYCGPTKYIFGKEAEKQVGKEVLNYGRRVLFIMEVVA